MKPNIKVIAHRGDSFFYPENSKEAIIGAYKNKTCDAIEIDIRMTKCKNLIVNHEMKIYDSQHSNIAIKDITLDFLKKRRQESYHFDWKKHNRNIVLSTDFLHDQYIYRKLQTLVNKPAHFITLHECLNSLPKNKTLFIEIKGKNSDYDTEKTYQKIIGNTIESHVSKQIYVKSFHPQTLYYIKKRFKNKVPVGILISKSKMSNFKEDVDFYSIDFSLVLAHPELIPNNFIPHKETYVWTIDDYTGYCEYLRLFEPYNYFPGIITNNPEIIYACNYIYQESGSYMNFIRKTKDICMEDIIRYALNKRKGGCLY